MSSYTSLPNSISDGKAYLSEKNGRCGIVQQNLMWSQGAFSNTPIRYKLFTNASLRGLLIAEEYRS